MSAYTHVFNQFTAYLAYIIASLLIEISEYLCCSSYIFRYMPRAPLPIIRYCLNLGMIYHHSPLALPSVLLLRTHAPNLPPLSASAFMLCANSLCRLLQASADNRLFPVLSLLIFIKMSDPLSRCFLRCTFSFLPLEHRPSLRA